MQINLQSRGAGGGEEAGARERSNTFKSRRTRLLTSSSTEASSITGLRGELPPLLTPSTISAREEKTGSVTPVKCVKMCAKSKFARAKFCKARDCGATPRDPNRDSIFFYTAIAPPKAASVKSAWREALSPSSRLTSNRFRY